MAFSFCLASKLVCSRNKKPTCQVISGGGLKNSWAKIETLDAQPPRARRHTHTAQTTDAGLRVLLEVSEHMQRIHGKRVLGKSASRGNFSPIEAKISEKDALILQGLAEHLRPGSLIFPVKAT
jgi:hypothetical protein